LAKQDEMTDEHTRFIASGYTEERWQQLQESRRRWKLKMIALRDWSYEQATSAEIPPTLKPIVKEVTVKQPIVKVENQSPALKGRI
jgi:hypothetical protein